MPTVQITTEALYKTQGAHLDVLQAAGLSVGYPARHPMITEEDTLATVSGAVAVLAGSEPYTARVLSQLPDLRVISRNGVGYDAVDVAAATELGIALTITPQGNHEAVAEHTFALLLGLARRIVQSDHDTRQADWRRTEQLIPLRGRTLGIVGLGRIGRSVATRAAAFKLSMLCYEPYPDRAFAEQLGIQLVSLDELFANSDFVTLHMPMSPEMKGLINRNSLARMRPGSLLINTARGGLVVEADLCDALRSGHLAGAGLDVFMQEPPAPDNPLFKLPNVLLSPHVAAFDAQAVIDMANGAAHNIVEALQGRWSNDALINPAVRERARR